MEKLRLLTTSPRTTSDERKPPSTPVSPQIRLAKMMAAKLFNFLPPLDIGEPENFIAAVVSILAKYPGDVMMAAIDPADGIPSRTDRPTLRLIKEVCEEYYAPIAREARRARAQQEALPLPPRRQRTPVEQAAVDEKVAAMRRELGIPTDGLPRRGAQAPPLPWERPSDKSLPAPREERPLGKGLLAELEARRARNQAREPSDDSEG